MNEKARRINRELKRSGGTRSAPPSQRRGCPLLPSVVVAPILLALVTARHRRRRRRDRP